MIVTLIEKERIFSMTLPDKVKGRFWITDYDESGEKRNLISVEADKGSWMLKNSISAVISNTQKQTLDGIILEECLFYCIKLTDKDNEA